MFAVLRPFGYVPPNEVPSLGLVKIQPYGRRLLLDSHQVGSHTVPFNFQPLLINILPKGQLDLKMDLLSAHDTIVDVVQSVVFESVRLVFGGGAGRTVPPMGQLEGDQHGLVVLSPLDHWGDCGDAGYQLPGKLG